MDRSTGELVVSAQSQEGPVTHQPAIMNAYGILPALAGGPATQADVIIPSVLRQLITQEQRYGNGEQPAVLVHQLPYDGPPLRYLLTGRQVRFCNTREEVLEQYERIPASSGLAYHPLPEYAASLRGPRTSGIARARINITGHAPSAITSLLAVELGLQRRPLRGPGAVPGLVYNGQPTALEVLTEPLTMQLLAGPGNVAFEVTLPAVVVLPGGTSRHTLFELQLGLYDFCTRVDVDWLPMWASQFTDKVTGQTWALPVVAPRPPNARMPHGSSTFHIAQESYEEVLEIAMVRQAVLARRTAVAAAAAGDSEGSSPSDAAQQAMQQASRRISITPGGAATGAVTTTTVLAAGTQEWVDEWAPTPQQQQRRSRSSQVGRRGSRRSRGRSRGAASRQHLLSQDPQAADLAVESVTESVVESVDAARAASGVYAGLDPLPTGLVASRWYEVAATSLPEGDVECTICTEAFTEDLEGGGERLVTQLLCRHTYCVLCLRQFSTNRSFRRRSLQCPQCRAEV